MNLKTIPLPTALALVIVLMVVVLDQATKALALALLEPGDRVSTWLPVLDWVLWFNPGAAFSFLASHSGWQRYFLIGFSCIAIGVLSYLMHRETHLPTRLCYALVLGGAIGNVIDRLHLEGVVDFILLHVGDYYWPAFNVADSAISLAVVALLVFSWRRHREST